MGHCFSNVSNVSNETDFSSITAETTKKWTLEGRKQLGKVLRVIDGDTVDLAIHIYNEHYQFRVRLYGIDTPEKRPLKSSPNRDEEIEASKRSTKALSTYLERSENMVHAEFKEADKYGRWLVILSTKDHVNLNEWMVKEGYAKPYFGGTKEKF